MTLSLSAARRSVGTTGRGSSAAGGGREIVKISGDPIPAPIPDPRQSFSKQLKSTLHSIEWSVDFSRFLAIEWRVDFSLC